MVKKVLTKLFIGVITLAALITAVAAFQKNEFEVIRSRTISAPVEKVFPVIGDFKNWEKWSPWKKKDPTVKIQIPGASTGPGAEYYWDSQNSGAGSMRFTEYTPYERLKYELHFKDWDTRNEGEFTFSRVDTGTQVSWSMRGKNNLMGKIFFIIFRYESAIGKDFDEGLAEIAHLSEK